MYVVTDPSFTLLTCAAPHNTEPMRKTEIPNIKIHLRPKISENLENKGSTEM